MFQRSMERWGGMPDVARGLAGFCVQPGAKMLLLPALRWMFAAIKGFDSYDWRHGLEGVVIDFLHTCWDKESGRIAGAPALKEAFLGLVTIVVSRGSPAAISLRDRVVASLGG